LLSKFSFGLILKFCWILNMIWFKCRENIQLSQYQDVRSTRVLLMSELKNLINVNNRINNKLKFPTLSESRLRHLVNQG
jgi:hypothetical protein